MGAVRASSGAPRAHLAGCRSGWARFVRDVAGCAPTRGETGWGERAGARILNPVSDRITAADVAKVARLARLDLTDEELQRTTVQLAGMLEHFADIDALDLTDVAPMTQPYPLVNVFRPDVVKPGLDRDEVLAAAPAAEDGRFRVPPVVGLAE
ncbi:MAG: gatC [Ilumatobacteraceae bacterium]|nr:gatC [Ilumatobacteraceae bacterium]